MTNTLTLSEKTQAKREKRRKQTAEDFTPSFLVDQILDKLGEYSPESWSDHRKTFIDPACGNGNFLVAVVERKLAAGFRPMHVAKTVYGLDIMQDNIDEARFRIASVFYKYGSLTDSVIMEIWKNIRRVDDTLETDFTKTVFRERTKDNDTIQKIRNKVSKMTEIDTPIRVMRKYVKRYFYDNEHIKALQNVHTPFDLCEAVVKKLGEYTCLQDGKRFLAFNHEFVDVLKSKGVKPENIWYISDCPEKVKFAEQIYGVHGIHDDVLGWSKGEKFDVVVGNPPYQQPQEHNGKRGGGTTLWDKFVHKAVNEIIKTNGYICFIHPCGWRAPKGAYSETKDIILQNQIHYLEIHDAGDGLKTFGAGTRYDWYVLQKTTPTVPTTVLTEDGKTVLKDITKLPFIPNAMFDEVMGLIAKPGEEKVNVIYSRSDYGSDKKWVSKTQSSTFKYPVIHSIKKAGLNLVWSSENRGMIGTPKVVFGCGQSDTYIDNKGEYGLTQHTRGIIDTVENLENINKALNNEKFIQISSVCSLVSTGMFVDKYNKDVLSLFRKDFWKDFI